MREAVVDEIREILRQFDEGLITEMEMLLKVLDLCAYEVENAN